MLPIGRVAGLWAGISRAAIGWRRDAEDHLDRIAVDLDPAHQGADDLPRATPVQLVEATADLGREVFDPADHQAQAAFGLGHLDPRLSPLLHAREPLPQAGDARLELLLLDHSFRVDVDQPTDSPTQALGLAIQGHGLGLVAGAVAELVEAAPVLGGEAVRILQKGPDLVPDRQLEAVAAHRAVAARRHTAEAVSVGAEAAVVAVLGRPAAGDLAAGHLAVECVAAAAADH
jgi:hypothetical protein